MGLIWGYLESPEVMLTGPLTMRVSPCGCPHSLSGPHGTQNILLPCLPSSAPERSFGFLFRARRLPSPAKATGQEWASQAGDMETVQLPLCWEF